MLPLKINNQIVCVLWESGPTVSPEIGEAFYRFTPSIALGAQRSLFLNMTGCEKLFPLKTLPLKIKALAHRFGFSPKISIAHHPGIALALAMTGSATIESLSINMLSVLLFPFELPHEQESAAKIRDITPLLFDLGLQTISDLKTISSRQWVKRFHREGLLLSRLCQNDLPFSWPSFQLPERLQETLVPQEPFFDIEPLLFLVKSLLDRLMARLWARAIRATALTLSLSFGKQHLPRHYRLSLTTPQGSTARLLNLLREKISHEIQKHPLEEAITEISVEITDWVVSLSAQRHFFDSYEEQNETWGILIDRLRLRLGEQNTFTANIADNHLPENAWAPEKPKPQKLIETPLLPKTPPLRHKTTALRPTRLLSSPLHLSILQNFKPGSVIYTLQTHQQWTIESIKGPERFSSEWWRAPSLQQDQERDYFFITTTSQQRLWVFRSQNQYFLHGFFD